MTTKHMTSRDEILDRRDRRLRRLVCHAYHAVAHYRRLMDRHGIRPQDIRTADDLRYFPVTTRKDLQSAPARDTTAGNLDPDRLPFSRTSGSTGAPLVIRRTRHETRMEYVRWFRMLWQYGLSPFDRRATIRTLHREAPGRFHWEKRRVFYPHLILHCGLDPTAILSRIRDYRPDFLCGYPAMLALLAEQVSDSDRRRIRPRVVLTGGEVLDPLMRRQIEHAFHAPVYDVYATIEHNLIALQCEQTGKFHVRDDDVILEIITDGRPARDGERGEARVTNLHAFSMPFIRYQLGDIVTMGCDQCDCGAPFSTIRRVEGRIIDRLVLPDGRFLHPYDITHGLAGHIPTIRRYQIVQEHEHAISLRMIPASPFGKDERRRCQAVIERLIGPGVDFRIEVVDRIPQEPGEKFRICRCKIHAKAPAP